METPAWDRLAEVAKAQYEERVRKVMHTHTTPDNESEVNFLRGEASGIELFMRLPQIVIDQAAQDLERAGGVPVEED